MSIDFLDRLEADLREAAERRGQPSPRRRPPNPRPALKALAVAAVLALLVVGGARLANHDSTERPAATPTPTPPVIERLGGGLAKAAVATSGDASSLDVFVQRLEDVTAVELVAAPSGRPAHADPSLGSVVLYRDDAERFGKELARSLGIARARLITAADEAKISYDVRDAQVVIVFGPDLQERLLARDGRCTPAGHVTTGALELCEVDRNNSALTGFLVDGHRLPVAAMPTRGHWLWAAASPDGKTILADWTSECDVPKTYLIDARGGTPRPATQGGSEAFGWTTDGHAIVANRVDPGCVEGGEPGLALVTPDGEAKQLGKAVPRDLQRTIAARDESEITAP